MLIRLAIEIVTGFAHALLVVALTLLGLVWLA